MDGCQKASTSPLVLAGLIVVFCLGSFLRLFSTAETVVASPLRADALEYFSYAFNLRHHHVYSRDSAGVESPQAVVSPDAVRSPGYALFLLPFVDRFPDSHVLGKIVVAQAILSCITILVTFLLFMSLLPAGWAMGASLLMALSPHLVVMSSYVLTETWFTFLIVVSILALRRALFGISLYWWALAGMLLAFASLVRPGIQYYPFLLPLLIVPKRGWKAGGRMLAAMALGFLLIYTPWVMRNVISMGKASDSSLAINAVHHGLYPNFTYEGAPESFGFPYRFDPRSGEISRSLQTAVGEMVRRFREEPGRHLKWFLVGKPLFFWSWNIVQGMGDAFIYPVSQSPYFDHPVFRWTHLMMFHLHWPLVFLSLLGSVLVWVPPCASSVRTDILVTARLLSTLLLYYTFLHILLAPFPRYSIPLRPFMYGMGLFSLHLILHMAGTRLGRRSYPSSAA